MTRPRKSLHSLSDWIGGDWIDVAWSTATVTVVLTACWLGFIRPV